MDTKIAVIVRDDLQVWQRLNVSAFTVSGIAGTQDVIGEPYQDSSGNDYLPMIKQPILIFEAGRDALRSVLRKALDRRLEISVYTEELFSTGNDVENRAAVRAVAYEDLNLAGLALWGKKKSIDQVLKGLSLHS